MDVEALIGEVAKRHQVRLDPHDPILLTVTLHEMILAQYLKQVNALIAEAQVRASAQAAQQVEVAKAIASRLVTSAAHYVSEQLKAAGQSVQAQLLEMLSREIEQARRAAAEATAAKRSTMRAATVAVATAGVLIGVILGLWIGSCL